MQATLQNNAPARKGSLAAFQVVIVLHLLAVLMQAVFAGQFLSGSDSVVVFHEFAAWVILAISLVQVVLGASLIRRARALPILIGSVFLLLGEALQTGTGYGRFLNVHIPLAVFIFGVLIWQMTWAVERT